MIFTNNQIEIDSLPKVEDIEYIPIEKSYLKIILFNLFFIYGSILASLSIAKYISNNEKFQFFFWYLIITIVLIFISQVIISTLGFKKRKYALREKDIIYTEGLLINSITTLPFNRIQHTEVKRSFIARRLGLSTLNIYSAGESGSDLNIKGLPKEKAETINAFLTNLLNERL